MVCKYGGRDTDLEHQSRDREAPPRILTPLKLEEFGIRMPNLLALKMLMHKGMDTGEDYCDILKQSFRKVLPEPLKDYGDGKEVWTKHGVIEFYFDVSVGKIHKITRRAQDFPRLWQIQFSAIMSGILENFIAKIFPLHVHCIMKNSPIVPMPFEYAELRIASTRIEGKNVLADRSHEDLISKMR